MNVEAQNKRILDLIKCEGKEFQTMQPELQKRFLRVVNVLLAAESIDDVKALGFLRHKFYNDYHQVYVDGDKRVWFQEGPDGLVVCEFESGNH